MKQVDKHKQSCKEWVKMKCPICSLVEMRVMENNGEEITFECPACNERKTVKIEKESAEK